MLDSEILIIIAILGAVGILLLLGGIAFVLVLVLGKRVRRLEGRLAGLAGMVPAPPGDAAAAPETSEQAPLPGKPPARKPPRIAVGEAAAAPAPAPRAAPASRLESLERLLGTRWLNWVGALVMLVGLAFLLKFLYDRGWIGPAGRVGIGLGLGLGILAFGELKVRKVNDLLSQAVSSSGIGGLFLTVYLAYKFYDFSGQVATFALLSWFAAFAVLLAVLRRGKVLVALGFICAYATPYLLSTGEDQAEILFSYLGILALAGALVRAARDWWGVTPLCFAASLIYYAGWYARFYAPDRLGIAVAGAAGLAALLGFSGLARGLWRRVHPWIADTVVIVLSQVSGFYFLWTTLAADHAAALGYVLAGISLMSQGALWAARRRGAASAVLENALLLLASGSLLLVIPAVLETEGAVIAWAFAAVVLADMGVRSRRLTLEIASCACLVAATAAGFLEGVEHTGVFLPVANRVFAAWFTAALAWFLAGLRLLRAHPARSPRSILGAVLETASSVILLLLLSYETRAWFSGEMIVPGADRAALQDWRAASLLALWALYPWIWLWRANRQVVLWLFGAVFYVALGIAYLLQLGDLHHRPAFALANPPFIAGLLLPAAIFAVSRKLPRGGAGARSALQLYAHLLLVALLSAEIHQGLSLEDWTPASRSWIRMALISVAWALYASTTFWLGLRRALASWRWFALALLGATLIKVVAIDMAAVQQVWRVLSFLVLGALLMGCSYLYTRYERLKKAKVDAR